MGARARVSERSERFARSARKEAWRALVASGLGDDEAASWCRAWELEAARQHLHPDSRFFWDAGRGWIDAQRSFLNRVGHTVRGPVR